MLADDGDQESEARRRRLRNMKKPITALSILIIAALTIGVAVAERMGQRAQQDRFSFGTEPTEFTAQ
jgi:hypothetical protein